MRPQVVVPGADGGEVPFEIVGYTGLVEPRHDLRLEREEEAFNAPVLPGAMRGGSLVTDSE